MIDGGRAATECRILIVEDDADSCEVLCRLLERSGYETDCAGTLGEAVKILRRRPDFVILDLKLPDGDGLALLTGLRESGDASTKVAIVTGAGDDRLVADAVLARPDAFFTKPLDPSDILSWLRAEGHFGVHRPPESAPPAWVG
jgi:two-component system OmpR family response regulator